MYAVLGLTALIIFFTSGLVYRRKQLTREHQQLHISVDELRHRIQHGQKFTILDLRHPLEILTAPQTIPGAVTIAPNEIDRRVIDISRNANIVLYCTCPNEETSLKAYRQLKDRGFRHLKVLTGGLPAWREAKLPLQDLYPELVDQTGKAAAAS
jgi:rhodanese-related sulfurtransferase